MILLPPYTGAARRHAGLFFLAATAMIPAAIVGIGAGAALALWLPPDALRVVFGGFFCYMGTRMARQALRR
jgi:uncharacterized membrane protein YfcA